MNRITVERGIEAYVKTGLEPVPHVLTPREGGSCGIGAVLSADGVKDIGYRTANLIFGGPYVAGFGAGFDNALQNNENALTFLSDGIHAEGHTDGKALGTAVREGAVEAAKKGKEKRREEVDPMPGWEPVKKPAKQPAEKPKRELVPSR